MTSAQLAGRNSPSSILGTSRSEGEILQSSNLKSFSYNEVRAATRNFCLNNDFWQIVNYKQEKNIYNSPVSWTVLDEVVTFPASPLFLSTDLLRVQFDAFRVAAYGLRTRDMGFLVEAIEEV
ncbi:hypothetical protein MTR_7g061700 [Medicago truncatula]|uniref:Uncharacterized protein n=1 Tax=Medicago truncatula TaxID=3880 RepID=A0A072UAQ2_MEDTR|nr:hypothetical protein MTR_7g061700 [Medicago truncatula]